MKKLKQRKNKNFPAPRDLEEFKKIFLDVCRDPDFVIVSHKGRAFGKSVR